MTVETATFVSAPVAPSAGSLPAKTLTPGALRAAMKRRNDDDARAGSLDGMLAQNRIGNPAAAAAVIAETFDDRDAAAQAIIAMVAKCPPEPVLAGELKDIFTRLGDDGPRTAVLAAMAPHLVDKMGSVRVVLDTFDESENKTAALQIIYANEDKANAAQNIVTTAHLEEILTHFSDDDERLPVLGALVKMGKINDRDQALGVIERTFDFDSGKANAITVLNSRGGIVVDGKDLLIAAPTLSDRARSAYDGLTFPVRNYPWTIGSSFGLGLLAQDQHITLANFPVLDPVLHGWLGLQGGNAEWAAAIVLTGLGAALWGTLRNFVSPRLERAGDDD